MLADISRANKQGNLKLVRNRICRYLQSRDARCVAILEAYQSMRTEKRPDELDVDALAETLFPHKGSAEPVRLFMQRKGEPGAGGYRLVMEFGLENRALQYLIKAPLTAAANLHPHQFGTVGVSAAITRIAEFMTEGYQWGCEIDIESCFPSFSEEMLVRLLPIPKEVIRHVAMSNALNIVHSVNLYDVFGPADNGLDPLAVTDFLSEARQGIPTGSAASSITSEILLSSPFKALPSHGVAVGYADNSFLMAKSEKDAMSIKEAFWSDLKSQSAGLLRPKVKGAFRPGDPVDVLGHRLRLLDEKVRVDPSPKNDAIFNSTIEKGIARLKMSKLNHAGHDRIAKNLRKYVKAWTSSFGVCDGIADRRSSTLARINDACKQALK